MPNKHPQTVSLFIQCLVDAMYPEVGMAMLNIFRKLDIPVDCPTNQTCCGQPAFNSGYRQQARVAARRFIEIFENKEAIVCPSGSCTTMVRHHYPQLFEDEPDWQRRAEAVAGKTFELTQYLVDVLGIDDMGARYSGKISFHDSCHALRTLGIREQPRQLIAGIADVELIEMNDPERCCGFGGSFSVKYPEISTAMAQDKVNQIIATGADAVVGVDISCLMNIHGLLSRQSAKVKILHIAELLAG
jgi:L-lactate dehydrogenase complex protein LldE